MADPLAQLDPSHSLFRLLTVNDGPTFLPHLQQLWLTMQWESRESEGGYISKFNVQALVRFCRSRLQPPDGGILTKPVLNRVCIRDMSQAAEEREEEPVDELRTWARTHLPELDFRIWFDDT